MTRTRNLLSVRLDDSLAEALLPSVPKRAGRAARVPRQKRFRDYVREKRRR